MKSIFGILLMGALASTSTGCSSYAGAAGVGDKVVIASNNGFLGGVFRKVYVCKVTDSGLTACSHAEAP